MKKVLIFAAVAEAATGLALLIAPSLVGQLLLGEQLTGIAIPVARVAGIALVALGIALLARATAGGHVDLQRMRSRCTSLIWVLQGDWRVCSCGPQLCFTCFSRSFLAAFGFSPEK